MVARSVRRCRLALAQARENDQDGGITVVIRLGDLADALRLTGGDAELTEATALYTEILHIVRSEHPHHFPVQIEHPDDLYDGPFPREDKHCAFCGKSKVDLGVRHMKMCSKCKLVRYCDVHCQTIHWYATHKHDCDPDFLRVVDGELVDC